MSEGLTTIAQNPKGLSNFWMSEDEKKKEKKSQFLLSGCKNVRRQYTIWAY